VFTRVLLAFSNPFLQFARAFTNGIKAEISFVEQVDFFPFEMRIKAIMEDFHRKRQDGEKFAQKI